jgi:DNA-binding transcriptional ArsR family regulator
MNNIDADVDAAVLSEIDISKVGALLADPARAAMLIALSKQIALPVSELAERANISASTASIHLARLLEMRWLAVEQHGRQRYYRLASPHVISFLQQAMSLSPTNTPPSPATIETHHRHNDLRFARTCYDHLAGQLGVALTDMFLTKGILTIDSAKDFRLTEYGRGWLGDASVDIETTEKQRRAFARRCLDWTERRDHLGGALGAAICAIWLAQGWIERQERTRALIVTPPGREQMDTWGIH